MLSPVVLLLLVGPLSLDALDSNRILNRTQVPADGGTRRRVETPFNSNRHQKECSSTDCPTPTTTGCSNRAQRGDPVAQGRQADRETSVESDQPAADPTDGNRTKVPEMAGCVRSSDCQLGLCCVRYLNVKRCQQIPMEGDVCLLHGRSKRQRRLGRCDCAAGLTCTASQPELSGGQGVCTPRQSQRKTRHSGKKRRTAAQGGC